MLIARTCGFPILVGSQKPTVPPSMCFLKAQRSRNFTYIGRRARLLRVSPCQSHYELVEKSLWKAERLARVQLKKGACGSPYVAVSGGPSALQAGTEELFGKVDVGPVGTACMKHDNWT